MEPLVVNARVTVPVTALALHAVRASGPGGQNVNKVSSKVELRVDIAGILGLTADQRRRLTTAVHGRLDEDGRLMVTSQRTRSQSQNLEDARTKVKEYIEACLIAPKRRVPTKPTRASKFRRLDAKRHDSERKRRRKVSEDR